MIAVFKREWRAFFRSLRGLALCGAFVFLTGLFVTVHHFIYGATAYEEVLSLLSVGVAILLPALTIPLLCGDRGGEEELFALLPLTARDVLWGKYLFALSILGLMTGILGACPLLLGYLAPVNLLSAYAALLGFALLELALLSAFLFLSFSLKKRWAAYAVSYGILAAAVALQALSGYLTGMAKRIVETVSVFGAFSALGEGRAEPRTWILYASLAALFTGLFQKRTRGAVWTSHTKKIRLSALFVAVALLLNGAALMIPAGSARLDLTEEKLYTVSEENRELLRDLKREVTFTVLNADRSDRKFEAFAESLDAASPRVSVRYAKGEGETELLERAGLTGDTVPAYTVVAESEKRATYLGYADLFYYENANANIVAFVNYYRAMYGMSGTSGGAAQMSAAEYAAYYQMLSGNENYADYFAALVEESRLYFQGEMLVSLAEYVAADLIPKNYILTGHGETVLSGSLMGDMLSSFGEQTPKPLDLRETETVPEDAASVLMLLPAEDYTEGQIAVLRSYLDGGGTLSVVTGERNLSETPNLMGLLASYGLSATADTVWTEVEEEAEGEKGAIPKKTRSDTVKVKINTDHEIFSVLAGDGSLAPAIRRGNAILMSEPEDGSLMHTPLLISAKDARLGESGETGEYPLAVAAETNAGARLVWFTGGESFAATTEDYSDENIYNVYLLMMSTKRTDLTYRSEATLPAAKAYESAYVAVGEKVALTVGIVTIFLLPLSLVAAGAVLRFKRRRD